MWLCNCYIIRPLSFIVFHRCSIPFDPFLVTNFRRCYGAGKLKSVLYCIIQHRHVEGMEPLTPGPWLSFSSFTAAISCSWLAQSPEA
ncbi:hypothetical protein PILCRDRAFT_214439 [Piloderma croceum F 1598]|uniref:Uncharacterized protein n=1 Tax=Piloderma croceum (strain F 1598) TaxID=765440 RepID=A0A0C3GBS6_PILCF|nr:hypothetical protein PILCRDRAFT_214439 [Piloderma croceum F 1598]